MNSIENPQLKLAYEFVQFTNLNVFLTGKAGTGKTTFLHRLKKQSLKRMIVVAPTGVAAINAGGVTIHSFFQMPFGPNIPAEFKPSVQQRGESQKSAYAGYKKVSRTKINIIKSLDLLIIDEISMVRSDLLDGVDEVLRLYRDKNKPFGGVQLLMIGDLQQLPPVIKDDEWNLLKEFYDTGFFFGSRALQKTHYVSIELQHIYRQSDQIFIDLLNKVRNNRLDPESLGFLNQRYIKGFNPDDKENYITLTTHNAQATSLNATKLALLKKKTHTFQAQINGEFPEYAYPTEKELELKVGAQVMFVKNDPSPEKLFYNGKIGKITDIDDNIIYVKCPGDFVPIPVIPVEWKNMNYSINQETKEIEETIIGSFNQVPLKLAWAITIHKSQGLTFDKVVIDAQAAFAHGQVYVALSRCRTLEGVVLTSPIGMQSLRNSQEISSFQDSVQQNQPDENRLLEAKRNYEFELIKELFGFDAIFYRLNGCYKLFRQHQSVILGNYPDQFSQLVNAVKSEIIEVAQKFETQIKLLYNHQPVDENQHLQERISKASNYFIEKIQQWVMTPSEVVEIETDNKEVRKELTERLTKLLTETTLKLECLNATRSGFVLKSYLDARAKASIESQETKRKKTQEDSTKENTHVKHPELFKRIKEWRKQLCNEQNVPAYVILSQKALVGIVTYLPETLKELQNIKGIGKQRLKQFGTELISMVREYKLEKGLESEPQLSDREVESESEPKTEKTDTKQKSLEEFLSGKSIPEIAKLRNLAISTIEGHIAFYVGRGILELDEVISSEKAYEIADYLMKNKTSSLSEAKAELGEKVSYFELRCVLNHLKFQDSLN